MIFRMGTKTLWTPLRLKIETVINIDLICTNLCTFILYMNIILHRQLHL